MFATIQQEHYRELGIPEEASEEEIKVAFRKKAMRWHPDRNKAEDAEEIFKRIKTAYDVLSDAERRRDYDAQRGPSRRQPVWPTGRRHAGSGPARTGGRKGADIRRAIEVPWDTMISGGAYLVTLPVGRLCGTCRGAGRAMAGACPVCRGSGQVRQLFDQAHICPECQGSGSAARVCPDCLGAGLIRQGRTLKVTLPAGISDGTVIRLKEAGSDSRGQGARGDVLLTVKRAPLWR